LRNASGSQCRGGIDVHTAPERCKRCDDRRRDQQQRGADQGGGVRLAAIGLLLGCAAAIAANRLLSSLLFGVGSADAATLIATAGVLAAVATIACYIPARHATRIDPLAALRAE
jgi:hypothetical protein